MPTTAENDFFRKKHTTSVAYLVGVLLFFLPFVQIKCNDMPFAENTGVGLAFGTDYKVTDGMGQLQDRLGNKQRKEVASSKEKGKLYVAALIALVLGVAGLIISLSNIHSRAYATMIIGVLAALSMIVLMIQINADVKGEVKAPGGGNDFSEAVKVSVDYTFWFYLSVCSFLAAAFFGYKHSRLLPTSPSRPVPQMPADETGFTKTASESGMV